MQQKKPLLLSGQGNSRIKRNFFLILLTGFCFLFAVPVFSQPEDQIVTYRIRVMGMNVGELTVKQQTFGNEILVEAVTDVEVKIIFTYRVKYLQNCHYRDGALVNSHLQTVRNDKVNSDTKLTKTADGYLLEADGDSKLIHDSITYSGSLLYFTEPKQVSCMYIELNGEKNAVKCVEDHTYVVLDKKGREKNKYVYQDGVLERAELKHTLATIHVERCRQEMTTNTVYAE